MVGQDGGQPWFLFWNTQSLELLGLENFKLDLDVKKRCISYLEQCHNAETGGFRGAPHLMSHVASSYAAVMAIVNISNEQAYNIVDIPKMKQYLMRVKNNFKVDPESSNMFGYLSPTEQSKIDDNDPSKYIGTIPGSMAIHENGEMDIRGVYCSLVCADILGILEDNKEFTDGVGDFLLGCQTYEGGFSCSPFGEAHGGYTFCALASFLILSRIGDKSYEQINFDKLAEWLSNRQLAELGGFNGRINKLIDSCYSYWVGASFELMDILSQKQGSEMNIDGEWLFNQEALQGYLIICCQGVQGGLRDKPTKNPDIYHTCYSLSGMSVSQSKSNFKGLFADDHTIDHADYTGIPVPRVIDFEDFPEGNPSTVEAQENGEDPKIDDEIQTNTNEQNPADHSVLISDIYSNALLRMNPIYNGRFDKVHKAREFFKVKVEKLKKEGLLS